MISQIANVLAACSCSDKCVCGVRLHACTWINVFSVLAGVANGVQKAWLDGKLVLDYDSIMFRYDAKHKIQTFTFNNFHGGKADNFRPDHDQWVAYAPLAPIQPMSRSSLPRHAVCYRVAQFHCRPPQVESTLQWRQATRRCRTCRALCKWVA